jgi:hypothetical protein
MRKNGVPKSLDVLGILNNARKIFYKDPNVIGIGIGPRRVNNIKRNEQALLVYVAQKLPEMDLAPAYIIPKDFMGLKTDIVEPLSYFSSKTGVDYQVNHHISDDLRNIDWSRLAQLPMRTEYHVKTVTTKAKDFGDVCVVEDDGTFIRINQNGQPYIWYPEVFRLFRTLHGDDYDFVTFFTDPQSGFPEGPTSFSGYVYNDIKGIGLFQTDSRDRWRSSRLQQFQYIHRTHFSIWRYVMLQEFGHRWACYANYKDPNTGTTMMDHRLMSSLSHWSDELDDDKSPMDYNNYDWIALPNGQFKKVLLTSDERAYSRLDLYLIGLCSSNEVGEFKILRDLQPVSGSTTDFTANAITLSIQEFINQEGVRIPPSSDSPKYWRQAFVVLTKDISQVQAFVNDVDSLRRRWKNDFVEATSGLGNIDTFLSTLFRLTHIDNIVGVAGYYAENDEHQHAIVATNNKVNEIWWNPSLGEQGALTQWHAQAIENSAFTPPHWEGTLVKDTPGTIVSVAGYYSKDDQYQHVILGTTNGIVREAYWNPAAEGQVGQGDLLTSFGSNNIVSVAGFFSTDDLRHHAIVGTAAGKIHEIWWKSGQAGIEGHGDLPVQFASGTIVSVAGYWASTDERHHVIVATKDGKVYDIWWKSGQAGVEGQYLLTEFKPGSIVRITGYYAENDNRHHVIVGTRDGNVHDFSLISHL